MCFAVLRCVSALLRSASTPVDMTKGVAKTEMPPCEKYSTIRETIKWRKVVSNNFATSIHSSERDMKNSNWTAGDMPRQENKVVVITGASSGLGKEASRVFAEKGARVVMAVRNTEKATSVAKAIREGYPKAQIDILELDLGNLDSVKSFSEKVLADYTQLDILINNAGVMMSPYAKTKDGFELQMGTNHLGHFALTGRLMPLLKKAANSRIVATASLAHRTGNINFEDLNWEKRKYKTGQAYSDSKIANLYFAYELAKRLQSDKNHPLVTAAHPGWTKTELDRHSGVAAFLGNIVAQHVEMGTLPTLRAAVDPEAKPGDYFGPAKFFEARGFPILVKSNPKSNDTALAKKLWDVSEQLTGVRY